MCNKKPGTRCSPHALEAMESAKKELDAAFVRVQKDRSSTAILAFQDAKRRLEDAQFEYNLSPDGQKILVIQLSSTPTGTPERAELTRKFGITQRCIERRKGALQELESPISDAEFAQAHVTSDRYMATSVDPDATKNEQSSQIGAITKELNGNYEMMSRQLVDHLNKDKSVVGSFDSEGTKDRLIKRMRINRLVADELEKKRAKLSDRAMTAA